MYYIAEATLPYKLSQMWVTTQMRHTFISHSHKIQTWFLQLRVTLTAVTQRPDSSTLRPCHLHHMVSKDTVLFYTKQGKGKKHRGSDLEIVYTSDLAHYFLSSSTYNSVTWPPFPTRASGRIRLSTCPGRKGNRLGEHVVSEEKSSSSYYLQWAVAIRQHSDLQR